MTGHHLLAGQRALVTGATTGIGRAIALRLAADGADVLLHGRDEKRGNRSVDAIRAAGGRAWFLAADLENLGALSRLAAESGEIDILVNNAGASTFAPTGELELASFDTLVACNVRAPFFLVAALAPAMAARGYGSIINISSIASQIGFVGGAAYGATKAALEAMTRSWAAEFGPQGVRVNAIAPGPVYTDSVAPEETTAMGATTPLGRGAACNEIAEVAAFLASSGASFISGAVVVVDGGRTVL